MENDQDINNYQIIQEGAGNIANFSKYFGPKDTYPNPFQFPSKEDAFNIIGNFESEYERVSNSLNTIDENIDLCLEMLNLSREENNDRIKIILTPEATEKISNVYSELPYPVIHKEKERLELNKNSIVDVEYAINFEKKRLQILEDINFCYNQFDNGIVNVVRDKISIIYKRLVIVQRMLRTYLDMKIVSPDIRVVGPEGNIDWSSVNRDFHDMTDVQRLAYELMNECKVFKTNREVDKLYKEKVIPDYEYIPLNKDLYEFSLQNQIIEKELVEIPIKIYQDDHETDLILYGKLTSNMINRRCKVHIYDTKPIDHDDILGYEFFIEHTHDNFYNIISPYPKIGIGFGLCTGNDDGIVITKENLDEIEDSVDSLEDIRVGDYVGSKQITEIIFPDGSSLLEKIENVNVLVTSEMCAHCGLTRLQHAREGSKAHHAFETKIKVVSEKKIRTRFYEIFQDTKLWVTMNCSRTYNFERWKVVSRNFNYNIDQIASMIMKSSSFDMKKINPRREFFSTLNGIIVRGNVNVKKGKEFTTFYKYKCSCVDENGMIDFSVPCKCSSTRNIGKVKNDDYQLKLEADSNVFYNIFVHPSVYNQILMSGPYNRLCDQTYWEPSLLPFKNCEIFEQTGFDGRGCYVNCKYCKKKYFANQIFTECPKNPGNTCDPFHKSLQAFYSIETPNLDTIFDYQDMNDDDKLWFKVILGMYLFELKACTWEVFFYLVGLAGTGKGKITENILNKFYPPNQIGTLSNNMQGRFSIGNHHDKNVIIAAEVMEEFAENFDSGQMQQLCSGEQVSLSKKHKDDIQVQWNSRMFFSGNIFAGFRNRGGALARRVMTMNWKNKVSKEDQDGQLGKKIESELAHIIVSCSNLFIYSAYHYQGIRPPLTSRFESARQLHLSDTDPFVRFMNSDLLVKSSNINCYISRQEFNKTYRKFIRDRMIHNAPDIEKETTIASLIGEPNSGKEIIQMKSVRKWPPIDTEESVSKLVDQVYYVGICLAKHFNSTEERIADVQLIEHEVGLFLQNNSEIELDRLIERIKNRNE